MRAADFKDEELRQRYFFDELERRTRDNLDNKQEHSNYQQVLFDMLQEIEEKTKFIEQKNRTMYVTQSHDAVGEQSSGALARTRSLRWAASFCVITRSSTYFQERWGRRREQAAAQESA